MEASSQNSPHLTVGLLQAGLGEETCQVQLDVHGVALSEDALHVEGIEAFASCLSGLQH